jgi:hypothetical protein
LRIIPAMPPARLRRHRRAHRLPPWRRRLRVPKAARAATATGSRNDKYAGARCAGFF